MRNPVNRIATAAPRAFESLLKSSTIGQDKDKSRSTRTPSFDLDLSALDMSKSSCSIGENSSVVTFEELADFVMEDVVEEKEWSL
eukprot:scaffold39287_cov102-Cyclotella_meneghiniana.AAC.1